MRAFVCVFVSFRSSLRRQGVAGEKTVRYRDPVGDGERKHVTWKRVTIPASCFRAFGVLIIASFRAFNQIGPSFPLLPVYNHAFILLIFPRIQLFPLRRNNKHGGQIGFTWNESGARGGSGVSSVALLLLHQPHVLVDPGAVLPHPVNAHAAVRAGGRTGRPTGAERRPVLLCAGGSGDGRARRQRALFSAGEIRQGVLDVGVLASFNLAFLRRRKHPRVTERGRRKSAREEFSEAHLLFLDTPLQGLDVVLHGHVDEPVLGFGLHHPRPLRAHHLDGLWHVDVAVHPCATAAGTPSF